MSTHILSGTTRGGDENATDEHIISDELQAGILKMADRDGATARRRVTCNAAVHATRHADYACSVHDANAVTRRFRHDVKNGSHPSVWSADGE